jgi:hypothetical protein
MTYSCNVSSYSQALELLRLLLDPDMMDGPIEKNSFLDLFYDHFMSHVMALLEDSGAKEEVRQRL